MRRREFITVVGGAVSAWPLQARAQTSAMPVVGWLSVRPLEGDENLLGFRKGLAEAGFVEGKNVRIEYRAGDGKVERLPEQAAELVRLNVAVIMAGGPPAAMAAKQATTTLPIVFTSGADPVQIGLVQSMNRPGGNATGLHIQYGELVGKRLSILRELVPSARRIAVLVNPSNPEDSQSTTRIAADAARTLSLETQAFNATTISEIDAVFEALVRWQAGAVFIGADPFLSSRRGQIADLAARHKLPALGYNRDYILVGGLAAYGPNTPDHYAQAGGYVGRILKGEKPADLPVQQPTKFQLVFNLKTAKTLGLTVPSNLLALADEVIE